MKRSDAPLSTLLSAFFSKYRWPILTGIAAIVIVDLAELAIPLLLKSIIDSVQAGEFRGRLHTFLGGLGATVLVQVVGRYLWRVSLARAAMRGGADFREEFSEQTFRVPISFYDRRKVGDLMTLATSDVENMRMALGPGLISLIDAVFYCTTIPIAMAYLAPDLTLKLLIPLMGTPLAVLFLQNRLGGLSRRVQDQIGRLGTLTQEMVAGVRIAKIYGVEDRMEERLQGHSHELNRRQVSLSKVQASLGPSLEFFLSTSLVLLFGLSGGLTVGTLVAMQRYLQKMMWPMSAVGMAIVHFQKAKASGREFLRFLEEEKAEEIVPIGLLDRPALPAKGEPVLRVHNLEFRYPTGDASIGPLSFDLHAGEWIGIRGPVAAGKSTLLYLLLGFYPISRGQIEVGGKDLSDYPLHELRNWFSSVLQDPYLFQGSIRSNLEFWDHAGTDIPLDAALKWSEVYEGVADRRLDEALGEKGTGLSGGQKQRLAIARALRKNAPIFLLDDPLSSVDIHTAEKVIGKLHHELRMRGKSVIFVSHRPEHLRLCDRIIEVSPAGRAPAADPEVRP
jgi:ATP-binding cassette subfamily B multidrug efflux pump